MFSIQYCATASSAANVMPTLTEGACQTNDGADQMNCLWNSRSGAFSPSRVKTISNFPFESSLQAEASIDTTALHVRSSVGGIMAENSTSSSAKAGRQRLSAIASVALISAMSVASEVDRQRRVASIVISLNRESVVQALAVIDAVCGRVVRQSPARNAAARLAP